MLLLLLLLLLLVWGLGIRDYGSRIRVWDFMDERLGFGGLWMQD